MVYRKSSRFSKKRTGRKPVYKKATVYVKPRAEVKRNMRGFAQSLTTFPFSGHTDLPMENIDTGSKADERIGNQITARGHLLSGVLRNTTDKTMIVRIIKLYNRRVANSDVSVSTDIFLSLGLPENANNLQFKSMYAPFNREQFKIVSDKRYRLGSSPLNADNVKIIKNYTKLNHTVKYSNGTGDNINWGNLQTFMLCYPADDLPGAADNVDADFESTVYYTE